MKKWEVPPFVDESKIRLIQKAFETSVGQFVLKKCESDMHWLGFDQWLTRYASGFISYQPVSLPGNIRIPVF